jgi:adenylate kinase family enzyme
MKRIAIIGCSGAGKSGLACALSAPLGIEAHHLDRVYLECRAPQTLRDEFRSEHARLLDRPTWIIDGNFGGMMDMRFEHADTIIFLDLPVHSCLWGVIRRKFSSLGKLDRNNKEGNLNRLTWVHLRYILLRYRHRHRPAILRKLEAVRGTKTIIVLESRAAIRAFLHALSSQTPALGTGNS